MGTLARIVVALALAAAGVVGLAYLLPGEAEIRAIRDLGATPERVYAVASDLGRFAEWTPWPEFGAGVDTMLTGGAGVAGQTLSWQSGDPAIGSGTLTLVALEPGREVVGLIDIDGAGEARSVLTVEPTAGGSRAIWEFVVDLGRNPLARYAWVLGGGRATLEDQLAAGLGKLAAMTEPLPAQPPPAEVAPSPDLSPPELSPIVPPMVSAPFPALAPFTSLAPPPSIGSGGI